MTDTIEKPRSRDRRPEQVPHHPRALTFAWILTGGAMLLMSAWLWSVMTGQGFILTAEQKNEGAAAVAQEAQENAEAAADQTQSDLDRQAEAAQSETDTGSGGKGGPPEAPDVSDTVVDGWELNDWSILSVNGVLHVSGELTSTSTRPQTGTLRAYVYIDGVPVATAKTEVVDFGAGDTARVNLVSDSDWEAGEKVVLLAYSPRK